MYHHSIVFISQWYQQCISVSACQCVYVYVPVQKVVPSLLDWMLRPRLRPWCTVCLVATSGAEVGTVSAEHL